MKPKPATLEPLDDLRSTASALLAASGLRPDRAIILANLLLWFDTAGLPDHGLATLPDLLDRIARGEVDPKAEGKIGPERAASAVLDGHNGPAPLILARAAEVATEKAREYGVGLIRVKSIGPIDSAAAVVAEIAIGPAIGVAFGPGGAWSVALPTAEGLPIVADAVFGSDRAALASFMPWSPLIGVGDWIIQAVSVPALEPLASFHERVSEFAKGAGGAFLQPDRQEGLRREARERGLSLSSATRSALKDWAGRHSLAVEKRQPPQR